MEKMVRVEERHPCQFWAVLKETDGQDYADWGKVSWVAGEWVLYESDGQGRCSTEVASQRAHSLQSLLDNFRILDSENLPNNLEQIVVVLRAIVQRLQAGNGPTCEPCAATLRVLREILAPHANRLP